MLKILTFADLDRQVLPPDVFRLVKAELQKILGLSGGQTIDNEFGSVFILEDDVNDSVESVLGKPFNQLSFEGMDYRDGCYIGYLTGGGNECLNVLICPDRYLDSVWRAKLQAEL